MVLNQTLKIKTVDLKKQKVAMNHKRSIRSQLRLRPVTM